MFCNWITILIIKTSYYIMKLWSLISSSFFKLNKYIKLIIDNNTGNTENPPIKIPNINMKIIVWGISFNLILFPIKIMYSKQIPYPITKLLLNEVNKGLLLKIFIYLLITLIPPNLITLYSLYNIFRCVKYFIPFY